MNKQLIYRVLLKGTVVGVFNSKNTHKILLITTTISKDKFEIEVVKMIDWLMQPRDF